MSVGALDTRQPRSVSRSIVVVEDDDSVRRSLTNRLTSEGFTVQEFRSGANVVETVLADEPDLVVLDVGLPDVSGLELLTELRRSSNVPVIVLSGFADEADRVIGLELGADDYVAKPHSVREVVTRVRTVLRRPHAAPANDEEVLDFGTLVIAPLTREVVLEGVPVDLTAREFDLILHMARSPRQVFSREQLLDAVWNSSGQWQSVATVTEHVRRVRRKLQVDGVTTWIATVWGIGYRFEA